MTTTGAPEFHAFGLSHLIVILLTIVLPFVLALFVHRTKSPRLERSIRLTISALLLINYVAYVFLGRNFGVDQWYKSLPLQLCDWAMIVIIGALWTGNRRWLEIAYFWGIGGTLQALITPNLQFGFPDLRFISFFIAHSGIIVGIIFLMLIYGFRPTAKGIVRTFLWTEVYFVVAFTADLLTGENYGFLRHKPEAASLLSMLSDSRVPYLLEFHALAFLFFCVLYTPFAIVDLVRKLSGKRAM
ncbi:MAG: TIGR02206 family membrane protein [Verrucomicrobia bacterium]|nr:MAG: TIGR02206 family membrane protein [Verrucomicrobiota bacterium]